MGIKATYRFEGDAAMKYRESGMPAEEYWNTFFDPIPALKSMGLNENTNTYLEIGCGYGTFLLPAATFVKGKAVGLDIDLNMIHICRRKMIENKISNIELIHSDISSLSESSLQKATDFIGLFNILHCEEPLRLLETAAELLTDKGRIGVIHWKYEETPRGPSMDIRPKPQSIVKWAEKSGLMLEKELELPPYHFGLVFVKSGKYSQ